MAAVAKNPTSAPLRSLWKERPEPDVNAAALIGTQDKLYRLHPWLSRREAPNSPQGIAYKVMI
jgi:hypothetical protein